MLDRQQNLIPEKRILKIIIVIRGEKVIMDSDLAQLYGVETRRLNEQVRRNIHKFPEDFMFQLSKEEFDNLKSQIATSSSGWGGRRKAPLVFTEHGALQAANVLNSVQANKMSSEKTKPCTGCCQPIHEKAYKCPHCHQLQGRLHSAQYSNWFIGILFVILFVILGISSFEIYESLTDYKGPGLAVETAELAVRETSQGEYISCLGSLKNNSKHKNEPTRAWRRGSCRHAGWCDRHSGYLVDHEEGAGLAAIMHARC